MNNVEKILNYMFHSKYTFFRPSIVARKICSGEERVKKSFENMIEYGVVKKTSVASIDRYFLTQPTIWILTNVLRWRR